MKKTIISMLTVFSLFSFAQETDINTLPKLSNQESAEYLSDATASSLPIKISEYSSIIGLKAVNGVLWADIFLDNLAIDDVDSINVEALEAERTLCEIDLFKSFVNDNKGQITSKFTHKNGDTNLEYKITDC